MRRSDGCEEARATNLLRDRVDLPSVDRLFEGGPSDEGDDAARGTALGWKLKRARERERKKERVRVSSSVRPVLGPTWRSRRSGEDDARWT
jgi:hypothetical protein